MQMSVIFNTLQTEK